MGKLYIVPTPIGNLEDITLRAVRILREADVVLAEDTRTTSVLLKHLGLEKRMFPRASPIRASCWHAPASNTGWRSKPCPGRPHSCRR